MRTLGIDWGLNNCAMSIINNGRYRYTEYFTGTKKLKILAKAEGKPIGEYQDERLRSLYLFTESVIQKTKPDIIGLESFTFHPKTRGKSIIDNGSAFTVCKLAVIMSNIPYRIIYPVQLRKYLFNRKKGGKELIEAAIIEKFGRIDLHEFNKTEVEHVFDSIAIAYVAQQKHKEEQYK